MICHSGCTQFVSVQLTIINKIKFLKDKIKACHTLVMQDTLKKMKRVLRRLGHISPENVVQTKGRVACEINTADELLCTELIFNGVFNDVDPAQAVRCNPFVMMEIANMR